MTMPPVFVNATLLLNLLSILNVYEISPLSKDGLLLENFLQLNFELKQQLSLMETDLFLLCQLLTNCSLAGSVQHNVQATAVLQAS